MQKRVRKIATFFAFNTLFFAVYLNLIHKTSDRVQDAQVQQTAAFAGISAGNAHLVKPGIGTVAMNK